MFTNLISKIHNCAQERDILQAGVESIKQAIECDRVVVYSLQPQSIGLVVAEAVDASFPRTIDNIIDDPCFGARYIDSYRAGRISAIEDIETAKLTPCHVENLQKLAVKANLVVPLALPNGDLYGLTIAHQCSRSRAWEQAEITLMAQMSAQIGWAIDNAVRWSESQRIQLTLDRQKHFTHIQESATQKIHQAYNRAEVLDFATTEVLTGLGCDRALVYAIDRDRYGRIIAEAKQDALASINGMTIEDPCFEFNYVERYSKGGVQAIDNINEAGIAPHLVDNLVQIAVKSSVVVPILGSRGELYGLLVAHQCFNLRNWNEMEVEFIRQLGIQTGLALLKAQIQEEVASMKSSVKRAGIVKETIAIADNHIQDVKESLTSSVEAIYEAKELMQMLGDEVDLLANKCASEDLTLIRTIAKKLRTNTDKANSGAISLQSNVAELETAIDSAIKIYRSRRMHN
jgi:GAF domain-containing protein